MMPLLCELDEVMISLQHGKLHRQQTIASGGSCCDYYVTGDRERQEGSTLNGTDSWEAGAGPGTWKAG